MVCYALYPAGFSVHQLGRSARAHRKYRLKLLHYVGVVQTFTARLCVAGVLLIVGGVLLSVEIIRDIAALRQPLVGVVYHLLRRPCGVLRAAAEQRSRAFQRQAVYGDVVRAHGEHLVKTAAEALGRVLGKTGDKVHIDDLEAYLPRHKERLLRLGAVVRPADDLQHLVVHGLGIHADTLRPRRLDSLQLFNGDSVRSAGFHGEFTHL